MTPSFSLAELTVSDFLSAVENDTPTLPAGGCAAALCAGLAAALIGFVARVSVKRLAGGGRDRAAMEQISTMVETLEAIRRGSQELIDRDVAGYQRIMAGLGIADRSERKASLGVAVAAALAPPLMVVENGVKMLRMSRILANHVYVAARSDALVGAHLAHAALCGGMEIAMANIDMIQDAETADTYRRALSGLYAEGISLYRSLTEE